MEKQRVITIREIGRMMLRNPNLPLKLWIFGIKIPHTKILNQDALL